MKSTIEQQVMCPYCEHTVKADEDPRKKGKLVVGKHPLKSEDGSLPRRAVLCPGNGKPGTPVHSVSSSNRTELRAAPA